MAGTIRWLRSSLLGLVVILGACTGMGDGPVPVAASQDPRLAAIQRAMEDDCLDVDGPRGSPEDLRGGRNRFVTAYVAAANIAYNAYERDLLNLVRNNDVGTSLASQLLALIGGASRSENLTRAAGLAGGAANGVRDALSRSLLGQTMTVLQTHMRASRAAQYAIILSRLPLPYENWDTCMALSDALAYEQAGTLNAALAAMSATASDEESQNQDDAQQALRRITFTRDAMSIALRAYLRRGDAQRTTAREALAELISAETIAPPPEGTSPPQYLGEFQAGRGTQAEREALVRRIVEKENGSEAGVALSQALPAG